MRKHYPRGASVKLAEALDESSWCRQSCRSSSTARECDEAGRRRHPEATAHFFESLAEGHCVASGFEFGGKS
jgi:hypothetical protein